MFDPYHKWLGILPKDQPPNHYRLLGVEVFEGDPDVIEGAVDRQMGFIRQYQSGEHAAAAAKILNELATARLCLLKPSSKAAYDAKLREAMAPPEPDFLQLPFTTREPVATSESPKLPRRSSSPKKSGVPQTGLIVGGIGIVVVAVVVTILSSGGSKPPALNQKNSDTSLTVDSVVPKHDAKAGVAPSIKQPASISVEWSDTKLSTEPAGEPIDLLKLVDLKRDVLAGEWEKSKTLLGPNLGKLYLPITPPDDYQLEFATRRLDGNDAVVLGFLMSGRQGMIAVDGWGSTCSGLYVDGHEARSNSTTRPGKLLTNQMLSRVVLTIHPEHLHVAFDGKTIIDWHGDPKRLTIDPWYNTPNREQPFIALLTSKFEFASVTLTPLKRQSVPARLARLDRIVDVVPLMDTDRDMQSGDWSIDKNTLRSSVGKSRIYLPTIVPKEYTLSMTVEQPQTIQGGYALTIGLVAGESYFQFTSTEGATGLDMIDGVRWESNETRLGGALLKPAMPMRLDCTVTKEGIRVKGNGKLIVDWRGDFRRLSMPNDWALPDARRLFIGASNVVKIREIKLGPPVDAPTLPPHPPMSVGKPLDLTPLIDPVRDAYEGTWERDGTAFRCRGDATHNKLAIPVEVPDEYKLTVKVTRLDGGHRNNEALAIGLPFGRSKACVIIDGVASSRTWIQGLESVTAAKIINVIPAGATRELVFYVRKTGLRYTSNNVTILDWTGNPESILSHIYYETPGRRLMIGSWNQSFRIEKLELEPLPAGESPPVVPPVAADGKLLPIIDPLRDARYADWVVDGDRLICPVSNIKAPRLRIPAPVPVRYVLSASVERTQGRSDLMIGLIVAGNPCSVSIDGGDGTRAGIDLLDGEPFFQPMNMTGRKYKGPLLPKDVQVQIRCAVTTDAVVVSCGEHDVVRWHGDPRRLSARTEFTAPNSNDSDRASLWFGSFSSGFVLRDLELKPLSDAEAEQISKSFSGVFPTTSQADVPLAARSFSPDPATATTTAGTPATNLPKGSSAPLSAPTLPPANANDWVDLLEWAEGVEWGPRGVDWNKHLDGKVKRTGLRMKNAENARFPLPAIVDGNYELEVEFTRYQGDCDAAVYFPVGIHMIRILLSSAHGAASQFHFVDGKYAGQRTPGTFSNNQRHRLFIRVQNDGENGEFHVDFDDAKDYFHWRGRIATLLNTDGSGWKTNMIRHVWVGSFANDMVFQKVRIKMLSGTIERDVITNEDREQDLKNGFVRLVGESARAAKVAHGAFVINQIPLGWADQTELRWPMVTREPKACDDFYGVHAPSRVKCPIPARAKSFSVIGYNEGSREAKYILYVDGIEIYDSGKTGTAVIKFDLPPKASLLELVTDPAGSGGYDHTYWCYPRFHAMAADQVTDKMLDAKSAGIKFTPASGIAEFGMTHNQLSRALKTFPVHFRDAQPCDEFLFAHASSTVTYLVPEGMHRFTAVGYNALSHHVKFQVWADAKQIVETPQAGIVPIDVRLPQGTKTVELKVQDLGDATLDFSMWCYPRLHRK